MTKRPWILGPSLAVVLILAACGATRTPGTGGGASPTQSATAIDVATSATLGTYLTTATGRTLYYFTPERDSHASAPNIACVGSCATIWPPLLAPSGLLTSEVTLPGTLKTIVRPDGGRQVTYSDWPLYTYSGDNKPGDTNGQGLLGRWFVAVTGLTEDLATPTPTLAPTPVPTATAPPPPPPPAPTSCIPGSNGGDHDADNNGGPNDGDGCQ